MITETITITLPPNLAAAARLDALARGEDVVELSLHYLADSYHHEVQAGHFPKRSSDEVIKWLLKEPPAARRIREAEEQLLRRARELGASYLEDDDEPGVIDKKDRATDAMSEATNQFTDAIIDAHNRAVEKEVAHA